ncbi:MAG: hypothetical protein J6Y20_04735 [Lachnospiraceae bacterium]|nr:hypothetical protein [Kiritimatiellia bacterium]MBP5461412.1 hypothetical protein [Lachnospiraceae bacterium]
MELTSQQVKEIVQGLRSRGLDARLRDVSFVVLASVFGDEALAFRAIFGDRPQCPLEEYLEQPMVQEVKASIAAASPSSDEPAEAQAISFDDLKDGLIADMRALEELREAKDEKGVPVLDPKEMAQVVARLADIRVKLTEKFNTTERVIEQRVVVDQKFDSVCPWCGREIALGPLQKAKDRTIF